jgi:NOL1/NOP2/fmu family ribosome biogenesis protein
MNLKILSINEKKKIEESLKLQFGINEISGLLIKRGEERVFLFQGNLSPKQITELEKTIPLERVGIYFAKMIRDEPKLSIEGAQILKDQIKMNIFELDKEQAKQWMSGQELNIKTGKKGFIILKYKDDLLGCGNASEEKITNFIPKSRRLKIKN